MEIKNILVHGQHGKPILTDIFYKAAAAGEHNGTAQEKKPIVIYAHGFNGFKDWGNFDLIARQFADAGFVFVKFNFSHNGTTSEHPEEFKDLEAYSQNNYTIELDDLKAVIDWITELPTDLHEEADTQKIYLLGHSLGGGIVLLKAAEDSRVKAVATWAAVSECNTPWGAWTPEAIKQWELNGFAHVTNSRTLQEMPLHFQLYENYRKNSQRLNIQNAIQNLNIPVLICHGDQDSSVAVKKAHQLKNWQPAAELFLVDSDHVFGRKHPWTEDNLPEPMQQVVDKTIEFLRKV